MKNILKRLYEVLEANGYKRHGREGAAEWFFHTNGGMVAVHSSWREEKVSACFYRTPFVVCGSWSNFTTSDECVDFASKI